MSQGALNKRMKHFSMILNCFWRRWKKEYLLSLKEYHCYSKGVGVKRELCPGDIVVMCDDGSRRGFWRLARIEQLIKRIDGQVQGVGPGLLCQRNFEHNRSSKASSIMLA